VIEMTLSAAAIGWPAIKMSVNDGDNLYRWAFFITT